MITTQNQVRVCFWQHHPDLDAIARREKTRNKRQNAQNTDIRVEFCNYVENLRRNGEIHDRLAGKITL